jgi:hypothetical protein
MANPTPIADLLDENTFADKMTVMCVEGTLKSLFKETKGNGRDGPYTFQNAILEDETGEIKVSFCNCTQPNSARGQFVRLSCYKSPQHGWTGLKIEDREYTNQQGDLVQERQLKATGTCEIEYPNGQSQPQGGGQRTQQNNRPPQRQQNNQQRPPAREPQRPTNMAPQNNNNKSASLPHPRLILEDLAALHKDVFNIVNDTYKQEIIAGTVEAQALVSTIFIEAAKQGCVLDYKARAAKELKKTYPPVPTDPKKWKECVLSSGENAGKTLEQVPEAYLKKLFDFYDSKQDNSSLAECVYAAADARGIIKKTQDSELSGELNDADIPF